MQKVLLDLGPEVGRFERGNPAALIVTASADLSNEDVAADGGRRTTRSYRERAWGAC
jgi:hypothetical protein